MFEIKNFATVYRSRNEQFSQMEEIEKLNNWLDEHGIHIKLQFESDPDGEVLRVFLSE